MISKKVEIIVTYRVAGRTEADLKKAITAAKNDLRDSCACFGNNSYTYKRVGKGKIK